MLLLVIRKVESGATGTFSQDILAVLQHEWLTIAAAAIAGVFVAIAYLSFFGQRHRPSPWADRPLPLPPQESTKSPEPVGAPQPVRAGPTRAERKFRTVFAFASEAGRQAMIERYVKKHGCGREEAMVMAVEDRAADENRW